MIRLCCALFLGLAGINTAWADNCAKPRDDFDGLYCLNKAYHEADEVLNQTYQQVIDKLDAEGRAKIKKTQLAWIKERNTECSKREGEKFYVSLSCATDSTRTRTAFLQARLQECAVACRLEKL